MNVQLSQTICYQLSQNYLLKWLSFPTELLWYLCQKSVDHKWKGLFYALISISLIHISVLMPVPHCINCCCFIVHFEIRTCKSPNFVLLFQDCFSPYPHLPPLIFWVNFRISLAVSARKERGVFKRLSWICKPICLVSPS